MVKPTKCDQPGDQTPPHDPSDNFIQRDVTTWNTNDVCDLLKKKKLLNMTRSTETENKKLFQKNKKI